MKKIKSLTLILAIAVSCLTSLLAQEENWASYFQSIPTKGYEGLPFRMTASVRAEIIYSNAAARLWVRIEKEYSMAFFENMLDKPIRSKAWKTYAIEGKVDKKAVEFRFGVLCMLNGQFYYDDFKVEVETQKGIWTTIYKQGFEGDAEAWTQNTKLRKTGENPFFTATIGKENAVEGKQCLVIESKNPFSTKN